MPTVSNFHSEQEDFSPWNAIVTTVLGENEASLAQVDPRQIAAFLRFLKESPHIFVTGEGRSGLVMRMFAMRLTHLGLSAYVVGDVTTPAIQPKDLLLVCSGSGATNIPCLRAERAKQIGSIVVAISGDSESRLARSADLTILVPQPNPGTQSKATRTIQFGGSRFEQSALLLCDMLAYMAMEQWAIDPTTMQARHANLE